MAPLPKRRHSSRRQAKRTRALEINQKQLVKCPQCGSLREPHRVCPKCGFYNGKPAILIKTKSDKSKKV